MSEEFARQILLVDKLRLSEAGVGIHHTDRVKYGYLPASNVGMERLSFRG